MSEKQTTAERFARIMDDDGTSWHAPDGRSFGAVVDALYGEWEHDGEGRSRITFSDGSVIVTAGDGWDFEGDEPWSWAGAQ